jgi:hypothetical protein
MQTWILSLKLFTVNNFFLCRFLGSLPVLSACACILVSYLEQHIFGLQKNSIWHENWISVDPARLGWESGAFEKSSVKNRSCIIMSIVVLLLLLLLLLMLVTDILNLFSSYCKLDMLWQLHTLHTLKFCGLLACQFITMLITCTVETCKF